MNIKIPKKKYILVSSTLILFVLLTASINQTTDNLRPSDKVTLTLYKPYNIQPEINLISGGWKPDCYSSCNGIHYKYFTENKITNNGIGFLQDQTLGTTPSNTAYANWIALTTDSATPAYTDTTCTSEITTNGLQRTTGTLTKGTPAAGTSLSTVVKTFTATGTQNSVDKACLFTASSGGTMVADTLFSSVNMANGDQLTINWQITITY